MKCVSMTNLVAILKTSVAQAAVENKRKENKAKTVKNLN